MNNQEVINYVMHTPGNTNPTILKQMLEDTSVQSDWNQNDSTKPDYVKNRPFYTGDPVETALFEDAALSNIQAQLYGTEISLDTSVLKAGLASKLVVNSVPYNFIWSELEGGIYAGNLSLMGEFEDTGEPYFMMGQNGYFALYWLGDEGATYSASLYSFLEAIEKLPEKFYDKSLPKVTTNDNDKYAVVVDGVWTASSPDLGWRVLLDKTRENAIATATNRILLLASEMKPVKELFIQIKLPENANSGNEYYIVLPRANTSVTYKISSQGGFYTFHFVPAGRSIIPLYALGPDGAMFPSSEHNLFGFTHESSIYKFFNSCYIELREGESGSSGAVNFPVGTECRIIGRL